MYIKIPLKSLIPYRGIPTRRIAGPRLRRRPRSNNLSGSLIKS